MFKRKTADDIRKAAIIEGGKIIDQAKMATLEYKQHLELEKIKLLDKIIVDDMKRQIRDVTNQLKQAKKNLPKKSKGIDAVINMEEKKGPIEDLERQKKALEQMRTAFLKVTNKRNKDINKKKIKTSDDITTFDNTFESYSSDEQLMLLTLTLESETKDAKKGSSKLFQNYFGDKLESSKIIPELNNKLQAVNEVNRKLNNLETGIHPLGKDEKISVTIAPSFTKLKNLVEGTKDKEGKTEKVGLNKTLKTHRDTDSATSRFWNKINNVLKFFRFISKVDNLELGVTGAKYSSGLHGFFGKHENVIKKHQEQLNKLEKKEVKRLQKQSERTKLTEPVIMKRNSNKL